MDEITFASILWTSQDSTHKTSCLSISTYPMFSYRPVICLSLVRLRF